MASKTNLIDVEVHCTSRQEGDFSIALVKGLPRDTKEELKLCEELAEAIRIRCADLLPSRGNRGVCVSKQYEKVCEYCGYHWGENNDNYNGGCCDEDERTNSKSVNLTSE